ncbi:MAG: hypothetical protein LBL28_01540 [Treponema sp.]|nr:hypothetical protein [Treponema sp.]
MKRTGFFLALLCAAGILFAQTANPPGPGFGRGEAEKTAISGNLGISSGMISLESGGTLYYVIGLNRFIGFIDGLKEGAAVSLEGYAFEAPRLSGAMLFRVTELRLSGKSYDLSPPGGRNFYGLEDGAQRRGMSPQCRDFRSSGNHHDRNKGPGRRSDRRGPRRD